MTFACHSVLSPIDRPGPPAEAPAGGYWRIPCRMSLRLKTALQILISEQNLHLCGLSQHSLIAKGLNMGRDRPSA